MNGQNYKYSRMQRWHNNKYNRDDRLQVEVQPKTTVRTDCYGYKYILI